jgi:hypothetical protein
LKRVPDPGPDAKAPNEREGKNPVRATPPVSVKYQRHGTDLENAS